MKAWHKVALGVGVVVAGWAAINVLGGNDPRPSWLRALMAGQNPLNAGPKPAGGHDSTRPLSFADVGSRPYLGGVGVFVNGYADNGRNKSGGVA